MEKVGVKETRELLQGINEVGVFLTRRLKDGAQLEDAVAFYEALVTDVEFKAKVVAAYENAKAIPEEISDLSVAEVAELVVAQAIYVPQYIAALNGGV